MDAGLRERVLDYLVSRSVATLSTAGPEGPWAAAVFFASSGFTLYFLSSPESRHCRNLSRDPRVAAAIHQDTSDWRAIKGVQLEGTASELAGEERAEAQRIYGRKFPLIASPPPLIDAALSRIRWYRLVPSRLYFLDNAAGFAHREELPLG